MEGPLVIGIAGHTKSGKTTLSQALANRLNVPLASFGQEVAHIAQQRGYSLNDPQLRRQTLMQLGEELVTTDVNAFCRSVLERSGWQPGTSLIIEGIRHEAVVYELRKLVSPSRLFVVLVDASRTTRESRLAAEHLDAPTAELVLKDHSTEREVETQIAKLANCRISGERDPAANTAELLQILQAAAITSI